MASQNLPSFQARKKIMKDVLKTAARYIWEEMFQVGFLSLTGAAKRKNRKVGNAQRTADMQMHTHIFLHL